MLDADLDLLIPEAPPDPLLKPRWGTVTAISPVLRVRRDGESGGVKAVTGVAGLAVSDRVWTVLSGGQLIVVLKPGGAAVPDATTAVKGKVELATNAETREGTDTERAVTPAGLAQANDAGTNYGSLSTSPTTPTNVNGGHVKMLDGTLICWVNAQWPGVANTHAPRTWTYPVPFIENPSVTITANSGSTALLNCQYANPSTTAVDIGFVRTNTTNTGISATAIGRWK